jgi:hypothetical protein
VRAKPFDVLATLAEQDDEHDDRDASGGIAGRRTRAEAADAPVMATEAAVAPDRSGQEVDRRSWGLGRWVLLVGFSLVAVALGVIANQAWLMGVPNAWVWWSSIAVVPPALTALAALFGWKHALALAIVATVTTAVVAVVGLLRQPPLGLPQLVCALAAVGVTVSARAIAGPGVSPPSTEPGGMPPHTRPA